MAEHIDLKNTEVESDSPVLSKGCGCQLCLEKPSRYTCPRCNVKYCSLECYKCEKHTNCSELFYKNCVMEALQDDVIDKEGKQKMLEILKRYHEDKNEDVLEEEGKEDLEERLRGLNLDRDTDTIWEKLTREEKREFEKAIGNGNIGSLVEVWMPWWVNRGERSVDGNLSEEPNGQKTSTSPKILKNVPKLQSLIKVKQPSSHMKYNLINVIYSYAYISRFYNGCHFEFIQEAVQGMWKLSAVLCHNMNYDSLDSALRSSIESSQQHKEFFNSLEFSVSVIDDISLLLKGRDNDLETPFVELALSEIYRLLGKGANIYQSCKGDSVSQEDKSIENFAKMLWLAKKKVYFMLSWFCENQDVCLSLEPFLLVVKEAIKLELKQLQDEKTMIEKSRFSGSFRNRKLIEEI